MTMDKIYIDELLRYGRGTKYHIYGLNIGLQNTNIGLQGTNIGLESANIGLKKKRYSKEEMRKLIIDYCQEWRTAEEIAVAVDKTTAYIRDIVLPKLSDVLEKRYDVPHHPKQKYRAKQ
jgi:hypothetical protein